MTTIRFATPLDAPKLLQIYGPYVLNTAITFEYEVPSVEEFRGRIEKTLEKYPYLVIEDEGDIKGYAYASPLKTRAAYDWSVETSIYVEMDSKKKGYGKMLYQRLEEELKKMGILNSYACIGSPIVEDEYLDNNSEQFHEHLGYKKIGEFHKCGRKFNRWYNMIWMEKFLGEHN